MIKLNTKEGRQTGKSKTFKVARMTEELLNQQLEQVFQHEDKMTIIISKNDQPIFTQNYTANDWFGQINLLKEQQL